MKKTFKYFLIAILSIMIIFILNNIVLASNVDMNLVTNSSSSSNNELSNEIEDEDEEIVDEDEILSEDNEISYEEESELPSTQVTTNSLPESSLGLGNILNIILIVVGVLIILLAIAILIRLKG